MSVTPAIKGGIANTTNMLSSSSTFMQSEYQLNKGPPPNPNGEEVAPVRGASAQQGTVSILVLGRSRAGKTHFIDYACQTPKQSETRSSHQATTDVVSRYTRHSGVTFKLIDTPGFDSPFMSDSEVLTKIAYYLLNPSSSRRGINGIIYIHQAGDPLQSRNLRRNLEMLSDLLLGENGLARLTIFVPLTSTRGIDPAALVEEICCPASIFSPACAMGTKVMAPQTDCPGFIDAMMSYASEDPIMLHIQQDSRSSFLSRLDESTWYFEKESAQKRVKELESSLNDMELELDQYREAYSESEVLRASQQETLCRQLQQAQQEFASLRSQFHLQDNLGQSEILHELNDLNRDIDDISRLISTYLVDNHVRATFGREPADVTALDAHDLPRLKSFFPQTDGKSSMAASSGGVGMNVGKLFYLSIRTLLCALLVSRVFRPFHPGIHPLLSNALLAAYKDIQSQEQQSMAGKWRSSTFKNIYSPMRR